MSCDIRKYHKASRKLILSKGTIEQKKELLEYLEYRRYLRYYNSKQYQEYLSKIDNFGIIQGSSI